MAPNDEPAAPPGVDTTRPTVARMYDAYLGGTNNYASDRAAVEAVADGFSDIIQIAVEGRFFLRRVVRYMCRHGIDQIIDIGSGLPSADNTHQVAQRVNPSVKVMYVDIDESAVIHGQMLLAGNPTVKFIKGSVLEPLVILNHPETRALIDFSRPVGILMMGLLHFFPLDKGRQIVETIAHALPTGSYLSLTHGVTDERTQESVDQVHAAYARTPTPLTIRPRKEIETVIQGFTLVEPGLVSIDQWRMEEAEEGEPAPPVTKIWAGVVVKLG